MNHTTRKLAQENRKQEQLLNETYKNAMHIIYYYLMSADISEAQIQKTRNDILKMFQDAEKKDLDVEDVIGEDYQEFCDHMLESVPQKTRKEKIIDLVTIVLNCTGILVVIKTFISEWFVNLVRAWIRGYQPNLIFGISFGSLVSIVLCDIIALAIAKWIVMKAILLPDMKENNKIQKRKLFILLYIALFIAVFSEYFMSQFILFYLPFYVLVFVGIMLIVLGRLVEEL